MTDLRDALTFFEWAANEDSNLPQKDLLETRCRGYEAAARGWRLLVDGEGDQAAILNQVEIASAHLCANMKMPRGAQKKEVDAADSIVLERYYSRDQHDLPLRHFVKQAIADGILDRKIKDDVHVNRLNRFLQRK